MTAVEQPQLTSRVVDLFLELCAIPEPARPASVVADRIIRELDAIGLEWDEDGCASRRSGWRSRPSSRTTVWSKVRARKSVRK